ncbi:MAG: lipoyl(octanoyl) transferase LipB [Thermodesulfobacteriota bacterium]|nr:lipoyl(octanoyl) transferase LipB [Thermodesulfobacteriota bacterium]
MKADSTQPNAGPTCIVRLLGRMDYDTAWEFQKSLAERRARLQVPDTLLFVEHPPTYTLGLGGREDNFRTPPSELARLGAVVRRVDRGGDVTFHGPGQLVGYPVIGLEGRRGGVLRYLRELEEVLIVALKHWGVQAQTIRRHTGVWVGNEKIAAIGVKVTTRHITQHGFALNLSTDLRFFDHIVPCGIPEKGVTSLERLTGYAPSLQQAAKTVAQAFGEVFHRCMAWEDAPAGTGGNPS